MLEFNEERHEYKLNGVIIPSVTQVIQAAGLTGLEFVPEHILRKNGDFGTKAHRAIQLMTTGRLDLNDLDDGLEPYVAAWVNFINRYQFFSLEQEVRSCTSSYGYTIDHIGYIGTPDQSVMVDIKTGCYKISDVIQICAYGLARPVKRLLILYIKGGKFKVLEIKGHDRKLGEHNYMAALRTYQLKKKEGLI